MRPETEAELVRTAAACQAATKAVEEARAARAKAVAQADSEGAFLREIGAIIGCSNAHVQRIILEETAESEWQTS